MILAPRLASLPAAAQDFFELDAFSDETVHAGETFAELFINAVPAGRSDPSHRISQHRPLISPRKSVTAFGRSNWRASWKRRRLGRPAATGLAAVTSAPRSGPFQQGSLPRRAQRRIRRLERTGSRC
jgi:hypothetical protein